MTWLVVSWVGIALNVFAFGLGVAVDVRNRRDLEWERRFREQVQS